MLLRLLSNNARPLFIRASDSFTKLFSFGCTYISITVMSPRITFEVEGYECSRCGHRWIPRTKTDTEPTICPKCKSPYWDKPRMSVGKLQGGKLKGGKLG